ncbi:unnamed protein product, partial [marine sediment metagenome]
ADNEIKNILNKEYKETITIEDGIRLAIKALRRVLKKEFSLERIDGAYIREKERKFTKIDKSKFAKHQK